MTTQPPDLKKLREVAKRATPGPWCYEYSNSETGWEYYPFAKSDKYQQNLLSGGWNDGREDQADVDADFIATFNPQTILALLDAYEAVAKDAERWRYACSELTQRYGDGYTEPRECSMSLEWTQGAWIRDGSNDGLGRPDTFPGWSAIVDEMIEEQKRQLDELDEPEDIDAARHATQGD